MSTLAGMRQKVQDWANRRDITDAQTDLAINLAVTRLERSLRLPSMEAVSSPSLYVDPDFDPNDVDEYESRFRLPADFLEMKSLHIGNCELQRRDLSWVKEQRGKEGTPMYFAREREFIWIAPNAVPANPPLWPFTGDIGIEMNWYYEVPELINDTDGNWFISGAEGAVLYGALVELFLYLRDQDEAALWEQKFQGEAQAIQAHADNAEYSGSTLTIKKRGYGQ